MESLDISHQLRLNLGKEMMEKKTTTTTEKLEVPLDDLKHMDTDFSQCISGKKKEKTEEKSALEFCSLRSRPCQEPRSTFLLSRLGANQHHINGLNCSPFV